ncbi:MAG: peptidoglycan DD-metalloendopeptidase family protein [Marinospirillum sp.]|uniref:peptidoglycan DD-metalloendopeptidase family protein n=1 Tax=Marinospirillum sp. TaxID=2183934 RepID=UPI0019E70650|nr:peptidoglycan DD-metalloendopeptidase family protein [Marinospirillum sp.]MBE0507064.1 peptidoglycan DD-metalloendopeptidase family protein [Marinospirillum sp.]
MLNRYTARPRHWALLFITSTCLVLGLAIYLSSTPIETEEEAVPPMSEILEALEATDFHNALIPPLSPPPDWEQYTLQAGDRLSYLWQEKWHLPLATLYTLLDNKEGARFLNRVQPGQHIEWLASRDGQLLAFRIWQSRAQGSEWLRESSGFSFRNLTSQREVKLLRLEGTLQGILVNSLNNMPEIAGQQGAIAAALDRHLPLRRDARDGDTFSLLVEQEWLSNDPTPYSTRLLAFDYQGQRMTIRAARHQDGRFYTPEGISLIPPFDRIPLAQRFRISSNFNLNRRHPVTGRVQPHYGTDFATPTGTPVRAPADGRVIRTGRNHHYAGNYLVIDHGQGFETRYLHLHRIQVNRGADIKRGQIIGQTGNTGRSTGPHLHYELHINGRPVDAMRAALPSVEKLQGADLKLFKEQSQQIFSGLDNRLALQDLAQRLTQNASSIQ